MEVFLIRHTRPEIGKGFIYGRTDVELADTFGKEKEELLKVLPHRFDRVYSSPSLRCARLAAVLSPQFITDERLFELHFGSWEGQTWDTIDQTESHFWMADYVNRSTPGGESYKQMQERVNSFLKELKSLNLDRVAVVTHAGVIRILLAADQVLPLTSSFDLKVEYGQVFRLNYS